MYSHVLICPAAGKQGRQRCSDYILGPSAAGVPAGNLFREDTTGRLVEAGCLFFTVRTVILCWPFRCASYHAHNSRGRKYIEKARKTCVDAKTAGHWQEL